MLVYEFEKTFYRTKKVNVNDFPILSEHEFINMEIEAGKHRDAICCYPYYCHSGKISYIDIYVWDVLQENGYKRFVITKGCLFEPEDEKQFKEYMSSDILIEDSMAQVIIERINTEHADVHIMKYSDLRHVLLHTYYTFHRNGVREVLFKANLNVIAAGLDSIEEYNLIGTSPQNILGLPIKMLRALNHKDGIGCLVRLMDREELRGIYTTFHGYICRGKLNKYQVLYLRELYCSCEKLNKKKFEFLGNVRTDSQYYDYLKYVEYKQVVDDYYPILPKYPQLNELGHMCEICNQIEWYIENESYCNRRYLPVKYVYKRKYEYEDDVYQIIVPQDVSEILMEAAQQHNCVYNYVEDVILGDTAILFMRKKARNLKALVTIEVKNGAILQAYRKFNEELYEEELAFVKKYARDKNLVIRMENNEEFIG